MAKRMESQVNIEIEKLKAGIEELQKDQRASFMDGIASGLYLAALIAKEDGRDILNDKDFNQFTEFLAMNIIPVKRRNLSTQQPKSESNQLFEDIQEFLRRAIAGSMMIQKRTYDESLDAEDRVNHCLLIVIAIGNRNALDDAIRDIQILRSITGGIVDRKVVRSEVESCYENFRFEVAAVTRFNEMSKMNFKSKDIWNNLRSNVTVTCGHDDEDLRKIDERYQLAD